MLPCHLPSPPEVVFTYHPLEALIILQHGLKSYELVPVDPKLSLELDVAEAAGHDAPARFASDRAFFLCGQRVYSYTRSYKT